jgi:hypothetical protein
MSDSIEKMLELNTKLLYSYGFTNKNFGDICILSNILRRDEPLQDAIYIQDKLRENDQLELHAIFTRIVGILWESDNFTDLQGCTDLFIDQVLSGENHLKRFL